MPQLYFKKPLQAAIREGRKCSTIRRWDRPRLRDGGRAFSPGVRWLEIESVDPVELDRVDDNDARADNFGTRGELLAVLRECYPETNRDGKQWFRVRFRLQPEPPAAPAT